MQAPISAREIGAFLLLLPVQTKSSIFVTEIVFLS